MYNDEVISLSRCIYSQEYFFIYMYTHMSFLLISSFYYSYILKSWYKIELKYTFLSKIEDLSYRIDNFKKYLKKIKNYKIKLKLKILIFIKYSIK